MSVLALAWRNIWRNRRRSLVTIGAMTLALLVMIQYSGLAEGYLLRMERNVLDLEVGDLQIFAPTYRDEPSLYARVEGLAPLLSRLEAAGLAAAPRLLAAGLAAHGDTSAGVSFRGVDLARDPKVSEVHRHLASGRWLDPADGRAVVIGRRLARTLEARVGSELVVLTQGADGSMANELLRVRGILRPVSDAVDRGGVFMSAAALRELLVLPAGQASGAHQIIVRRPPDLPLAQAAARARAAAPGLDVQTWRQLMPTISSMLDSTRGMIYVMFLIVYIAIGIVILNAMLMAVFERIREFGVLKALGMGPGRVLRLILTESLLQTGLAILVGGLLSLPGLWYLATHGVDTGALGGVSILGMTWDSTWRAHVTARTFTGPVFMLLGVVGVAVLYPAVKAALIKPVAAMRHQ